MYSSSLESMELALGRLSNEAGSNSKLHVDFLEDTTLV